jgi:hypothetical protein
MTTPEDDSIKSPTKKDQTKPAVSTNSEEGNLVKVKKDGNISYFRFKVKNVDELTPNDPKKDGKVATDPQLPQTKSGQLKTVPPKTDLKINLIPGKSTKEPSQKKPERDSEEEKVAGFKGVGEKVDPKDFTIPVIRLDEDGNKYPINPVPKKYQKGNHPKPSKPNVIDMDKLATVLNSLNPQTGTITQPDQSIKSHQPVLLGGDDHDNWDPTGLIEEKLTDNTKLTPEDNKPQNHGKKEGSQTEDPHSVQNLKKDEPLVALPDNIAPGSHTTNTDQSPSKSRGKKGNPKKFLIGGNPLTWGPSEDFETSKEKDQREKEIPTVKSNPRKGDEGDAEPSKDPQTTNVIHKDGSNPNWKDTYAPGAKIDFSENSSKILHVIKPHTKPPQQFFFGGNDFDIFDEGIQDLTSNGEEEELIAPNPKMYESFIGKPDDSINLSAINNGRSRLGGRSRIGGDPLNVAQPTVLTGEIKRVKKVTRVFFVEVVKCSDCLKDPRINDMAQKFWRTGSQVN